MTTKINNQLNAWKLSAVTLGAAVMGWGNSRHFLFQWG